MKHFIKSKIIPAIAHPVLKKIQRYRDAHKGEECYLFGDGSSIKYFDLKNFSNKISIPCGLLPFHKDIDLLNMPYGFLIENSFFYPFQRVTIPPYNWIRNRMQAHYHQFIKRRKNIQFFLSVTNYPTVREMNVSFFYNSWVDPRLPMNHIARRINCYQGTVRGSIYLAIYMGFSKIYLVGFDYTHQPGRLLHWYEHGIGTMHSLENYEKDFFSISKEYADIYTVTVDGTSEFLKPITYQSLTNQEINYRENNLLLTDESMKVLSTWPDYIIY